MNSAIKPPGIRQQAPGGQATPQTAAHFEALFAADEDPWRYRSRWYEIRKRALTLACLPAPRYASGYEPGCANGELSADLASRCDRLLVSDASARATEIARRRLATLAHVQVIEAALPVQWPVGAFDLVVVSEVGYYLGAADLALLAACIRRALLPGGTVLACHWRPPIEGCALAGDEVNALLGAALGMACLTELVEADLRLNVWSPDPRSVAWRDGLP